MICGLMGEKVSYIYRKSKITSFRGIKHLDIEAFNGFTSVSNPVKFFRDF